MAVVIEKSKFISKIFFGVFWIVAITPFFGQELMLGVYEKLSSPMFALIDLAIIFLGLWTLKRKVDKFILLLFAAVAYISSCIFNDLSIIFFLNGLRLYIAYMMVVPIYNYFFSEESRRNAFVGKMDKALYIFLWFQFPTAVIQCVLYGAYDYVGGSLGWMMSGEMSTLVYLISFYFMHKKWDKDKSYIINIKENWVLILLLLPSFLNETKISFVYLLMYFFFLLPMDRKFIKRMLIFIPSMLVVILIAGYFYLSVTGASDDVMTEQYITMYLTGDDEALTYIEVAADKGVDEIGDDQGDLFRGIKFAAIPFVQMREPHAPYLGFGVGQFKGGSSIDKSEFAKEFDWLLKGTVMGIFAIIIELGYAGIILIALFWWTVFRKQKDNVRNRQITFYLILTILLLGVYNNAFICVPFYLILIYISLISQHWNYTK